MQAPNNRTKTIVRDEEPDKLTVLAETALTLGEVQDELEPILKKRVDKSCLIRWINKGLRGIRLNACRIGGMWVTSREALTEFIRQTTSLTSSPTMKPR